MIHHISISANQPLHVAQVLAEIFQGKAAPFPGHPESYVALMLDPKGTMIEVLPKGTEIIPASEGSHFSQNSRGSTYTATHAAISVPIHEAEIQTIADREGWQSVKRDRHGYFEVIEFWIENQVMIELLPPALARRYLAIMQPELLDQILTELSLMT